MSNGRVGRGDVGILKRVFEQRAVADGVRRRFAQSQRNNKAARIVADMKNIFAGRALNVSDEVVVVENVANRLPAGILHRRGPETRIIFVGHSIRGTRFETGEAPIGVAETNDVALGRSDFAEIPVLFAIESNLITVFIENGDERTLLRSRGVIAIWRKICSAIGERESLTRTVPAKACTRELAWSGRISLVDVIGVFRTG